MTDDADCSSATAEIASDVPRRPADATGRPTGRPRRAPRGARRAAARGPGGPGDGRRGLAAARRARARRERRAALLRVRHRRQRAGRRSAPTGWPSAWDQNAGLYVIVAGRRGRRGGGRRVAGRAARPAGRDERRLRDRRDDGELHRRSPPPATRVLARAGWDVERHGLRARRRSPSSRRGTHVTIYAALQMLGLGREGDRVRRIAADDQGRMRPTRCARCSPASTGRRSCAPRPAT